MTRTTGATEYVEHYANGGLKMRGTPGSAAALSSEWRAYPRDSSASTSPIRASVWRSCGAGSRAITVRKPRSR